MFIGTGTGFAPLYFQIRALIERNITSSVRFVFGVRDSSDLFYQTELQAMTQSLPWLQFTQYMSRETAPDTVKGCDRRYHSRKYSFVSGILYLRKSCYGERCSSEA